MTTEFRNLANTMICWSSATSRLPTAGQILLVDWPDTIRANAPYECTTGACWSAVRDMNYARRALFLHHTALELIIFWKLDPLTVDKALYPIREYGHVRHDFGDLLHDFSKRRSIG